jgi:CheY-like chemotaxis protein
MDAETRARAVEPFFTTKGPGHGTGLGLSTVWGTVEHAGGRVVLDSEAGQGSTVTLYLPELGVAEGAEQVSRAAAAPSTLNTTVLVVDDDADVRTLTARLLVEAGHRVEQAADAASALAVWARRRELIGALVTDVVMPGSNGVELVERLLHERADLAVVVVSGYPGDAIPQRLDGHDVVFLAQPFAADALLSALHQAQEASRRRASGVTRLA